jgi:hypothetical protein
LIAPSPWLLALVALAVVLAIVAILAMRRRPVPPAVPRDQDAGVLSERPLVREVTSPRPTLFRCAEVAGTDALAAIAVLDALGAREGWIPVFIGSKKDAPGFGLPEEDPEGVLARAAAIDVPAWLAQRKQDRIDDQLDDEQGDAGAEIELLGEWPDDDIDAIAPPEYYVFNDPLTRKPHDKLYVALVPVREAWQAPAYIQNGSWNEVPAPCEQVAVLRHWHASHGARLRCFSDDIMEFEVARPPREHEAGLALAREQYIFCPDLVEQGAGALRPLAHSLLDSPRWFFWWD